jgi:hypothetical protein
MAINPHTKHTLEARLPVGLLLLDESVADSIMDIGWKFYFRTYYNGKLDEEFYALAISAGVINEAADLIAASCEAERKADTDPATWRVEIFRVPDEDPFVVRESAPLADEEGKPLCLCGGMGYVLDEHNKIARCHNCNP